MPMRQLIIQNGWGNTLAAGSVGTFIVSFFQSAWPVIQGVMGICSIAAAIASVFVSVATYRNLQRQTNHQPDKKHHD